MELAYQFGTEQADAPDELSQVVEQLALVNRELSQRSRLRAELIARIKALALEL